MRTLALLFALAMLGFAYILLLAGEAGAWLVAKAERIAEEAGA